MADTQSRMAFEQLGLGSVLSRNRLFVPPNQREYAWTDLEVSKLFQDLARAIADNEPGYFLGTIVTIPRSDDTLEVVDGQQRLATTAILLAAIRDYLVGSEEDLLVESINNDFLIGIDRSSRSRVARLRLNVDDNELFSWIIEPRDPDRSRPDATKSSHHLLNGAYAEARKHVRNTVSNLDPKDHGDQLDSWVSFIEHRALIVLLRVSNDANAYKMFETLNDRGLRTSQADLIKNYLFGQSGDRIQEVQNSWSYMRGTLESLGDENLTVDFLRHVLIAKRGHTREAQVFDTVQRGVRGKQQAVRFAAELEALATTYVAIFNPEHEQWNGYPDSSRRAIQVFNLLNIRPMRALLLAVTAKLSPGELEQTFPLLVSLGVRLLIASSTRSGSVELPLADAANDVYTGKIATAYELRKQLNGATPTDEEFRSAFESARVSKGPLARYYLRALEEAAQGEAEPWFIPTKDPDVINLEHILPKKPEGNWPEFSDDEAAMYTNRLGNQALMRASDNSTLGSEGFSEKKEIYKNSPYRLTSQIAEFDNWSPTSIATRQKALADLALLAWPI